MKSFLPLSLPLFLPFFFLFFFFFLILHSCFYNQKERILQLQSQDLLGSWIRSERIRALPPTAEAWVWDGTVGEEVSMGWR